MNNDDLCGVVLVFTLGACAGCLGMFCYMAREIVSVANDRDMWRKRAMIKRAKVKL